MSSRKGPSSSATPAPKLVALVHDPRTDRHHRLLRFATNGGESRTLLLLNQTLAQGDRAVVRALAEADYPAPSGSADQRRLVQAIETQQTRRRLLLVDQVGWSQDSLFTLPDKMFGRARSSIHAALRPGYPADKFACSGTLGGWQDEVVSLATGNHVLLFTLALPFAPPLLRLLGLEGGGFQLVAPTRTGKSSATKPGASVWGRRSAETWRTTVNALERTATDHNDLLLILDEIALLGSDPRSRADQLYEAAHELFGGRGKQRLNDTEPPRQWLTLCLSTSELTFRKILAAGGRTAVGGELMRLIDIELPVTATGIFQDLHGHATVDEFCAALDRAVGRHHGVAGHAYLRKLVRELERDRDTLIAWLRARMDHYLRRVSSAVRGREAEAVARRFAIVYAAGRLAARYRLLLWSWREMLAAVRYCHAHALRQLPPEEAEQVDPAQVVAAYIASHRAEMIKLRSRKRLTPKELREAPGLIYETGAGRREYLFASETFRRRVCRGLGPGEAVGALQAAGLITRYRDGKSTVLRSLPLPVDRTRVVCISGEIDRLAPGSGRGGSARAKR